MQAAINDNYLCIQGNWAVYSPGPIQKNHGAIVEALLKNLEKNGLLKKCEKSIKKSIKKYKSKSLGDGQYEIQLKILGSSYSHLLCIEQEEGKLTKQVVERSVLNGQFYQMLLAKLKNKNE